MCYCKVLELCCIALQCIGNRISFIVKWYFGFDFNTSIPDKTKSYHIFIPLLLLQENGLDARFPSI